MAYLNNNDLTDRLELDPADGRPYIDELQDRLLELLSSTQTIEEVEERLRKLYPQSNLIDLAIKEAQRQRNDSHKTKHHSMLIFAVAKVSNLVRDGVVANKAENELYKYKLTLIQFIIDDVLNLAGDFVRRQKNNFLITRSDIRTAMHADKDLVDMFLSNDKSLLITENHPILARIGNDGGNNGCTISEMNCTYKQKLRDMVDSENSFIRGLKLIIKVFKAQLEKLPHIKKEVQILFCNINELLELSTQLLTVLEDALESVGQNDDVPFVGSDILELAQAEEFHAYFNFAHMRLNQEGTSTWKRAYLSIVTNEATMTSIRTAGQSFDLAVKHLLPNYLLNTIIQFFEYFKNISELYHLSKNRYYDDELALKETISILIKTKKAIEDLLERDMSQESIEPLEPKQAESVRNLLEKRLDIELQHERNLPLPFMPPPNSYRFSEPDSKDNIQFEDFIEPHQIPVIRCATLTKLVERLTYHKYHPNIVDCFLTTYRSFISDPEELLDLLIERFKIPNPPVWVVYPHFSGSSDDLPECEQIAYRQYIKRFCQEYSKPVKMRVINVLKSWIKNHYYDFERHETLSKKLNSFLDEVHNSDKVPDNVLRKLIVSIKDSIEKKKLSQHDEFELMLSQEPPPILWWTATPSEVEKFDILTLHPVEFARQMTLIEFDLFRKIRPSELINVRDLGLRSKKDDSSPNLSRMTRHFTLLSYWIRKCIVETEDFDKRSAIYNRAIEIMGVLKELNNFTGLLSIGSAIESAPITRLFHTKRTTTNTTLRIIEDYRSLNDSHQKKLQQELKKCNPPCIPYLGSYQTKLIHAKEGNKTFIDEVDTSTISPTLSNDEFQSSFSNSPATPISPIQNLFFGGPGCVQPPPKMINFTKQRIRAGLVAEITNYQNPPYCLKVQPEIKQFIESIEQQMIDFGVALSRSRATKGPIEQTLDDYLFEQSERIEPKNCQKPTTRSKSKLPDCWKSPGIKTH